MAVVGMDFNTGDWTSNKLLLSIEYISLFSPPTATQNWTSAENETCDLHRWNQKIQTSPCSSIKIKARGYLSHVQCLSTGKLFVSYLVFLEATALENDTILVSYLQRKKKLFLRLKSLWMWNVQSCTYTTCFPHKGLDLIRHKYTGIVCWFCSIFCHMPLYVYISCSSRSFFFRFVQSRSGWIPDASKSFDTQYWTKPRPAARGNRLWCHLFWRNALSAGIKKKKKKINIVLLESWRNEVPLCWTVSDLCNGAKHWNHLKYTFLQEERAARSATQSLKFSTNNVLSL